MVLQGWPLGQLSQSYKWNHDKFYKDIIQLISYFGPTPAYAGAIFGPKKYIRTKGKPNVYTETFETTPVAGILNVKNGEEDGSHRISSALIFVNG